MNWFWNDSRRKDMSKKQVGPVGMTLLSIMSYLSFLVVSVSVIPSRINPLIETTLSSNLPFRKESFQIIIFVLYCQINPNSWQKHKNHSLYLFYVSVFQWFAYNVSLFRFQTIKLMKFCIIRLKPVIFKFQAQQSCW